MALRVFLALGFSLLIAGASRAHAQTSVDDALLLAKRIAGVSVSAQGTFGGLPPNWTPTVPLPAAVPVLGSIANQAPGFVSIFYRPSDARQTFDAYVAELKGAGFIDLFRTSLF